MADLYFVDLYIRNNADLINGDLLYAFFRTLARQGHYVTGSDWDSVYGVRYKVLYNPTRALSEQESKIDTESIFVPAVSSTLDTDVQHFIQDGTEELSIYLHSTARDSDLKDFDCTISIMPKEGIIKLVYDDYLEYPPFGHVLDVLQTTYNFWHPFYGYQETFGNPPLTSRSDALAGNIHYLYHINIFGPELVQKIGRDRLLQAPAWRKQPLEDGGIMLVPSISFVEGELPPNANPPGGTKATAEYLNLIDYIPDEDDEDEE
jgi:hypothetical protein